MKILVPLFLVIFFTSALFSQPKVEKLFEKSYKTLPFQTRIENSGIYGAAKFDVKNNVISISSYNDQAVFQFSKTAYLGKINLTDYPKNLAPETEKDDENSTGYSVLVENRNTLKLIPLKTDGMKPLVFRFPNNLAYCDVIGKDKEQNIYLIIEKYISDLPLKIKKEVFCINSDGSTLSVLEIPPVKFLSTINDFQVDEEGNLYHMYSDPEKLSIYKWSGLNNYNTNVIKYPFSYDENFDLSKYLPTQEAAAVASEKPSAPMAQISRLSAIKTGDAYVLYRYNCTQANLAPADVTDPGGDKVRTPAWVVLGPNAKIPYMWGGFNTLAQFTDGIKKGRFAGDINTAGISNYSVGVDCSGFVSRCWQLTYHSTTSDMPNITYPYTSWDDIRPGDAILKSGHVRLFVEKTAKGALRVIESSGRDWGVSYWTYTPSELSANGYTPRYYKNMMSEYSVKRPDIVCALITDETGNGKVTLTWVCDTTGVIGYRIYKSSDGTNYTQVLNESTVKTTSAGFALTQKAEYYRVASVTDSTLLIESNWSTPAGVSNQNSAKKALIVDGLEREGVWRGTGNPFMANYGKALESGLVSFETAKTSYIQSTDLNLKKYFAVFWLVGDESTENETFNSKEQSIVKSYLENGGALFVSGAEIGWDLSNKGTTEDKLFYNNYLKASYISDNSNSKAVKAVSNTMYSGYNFNIGQTTPVDYPDEIGTNGGSVLCYRYDNDKGAGIAYSGKFGSSVIDGKVIYLGFPLESTANDTTFNLVIAKTVAFFNNQVNGVSDNKEIPQSFSLKQNYPNPFNPSTTINYTIPFESKVSLKIYDLLGRETATLIDEVKPAGTYNAVFNKKLSSGVYFYRLNAGGYSETKQMIILK